MCGRLICAIRSEPNQTPPGAALVAAAAAADGLGPVADRGAAGRTSLLSLLVGGEL